MEVKIAKMWTNPELSLDTQVVTQVRALFIGEYATAEWNWALDCEDLSNILPFEQLTEETVVEWVRTQMLPEQWQGMEDSVDLPPITVTPAGNNLPWEQGE